jgi:hypothetical protein
MQFHPKLHVGEASHQSMYSPEFLDFLHLLSIEVIIQPNLVRQEACMQTCKQHVDQAAYA